MTPLTEKQLEAAARELCRLKGDDPDKPICESILGYRNDGLVIEQGPPTWTVIAKRLKERDLETIALSVGREAEP